MSKRFEYLIGDGIIEIIKEAILDIFPTSHGMPSLGDAVVIETGNGGMNQLIEWVNSFPIDKKINTNIHNYYSGKINEFKPCIYRDIELPGTCTLLIPSHNYKFEEYDESKCPGWIYGYRITSYNYALQLPDSDEVLVDIVAIGYRKPGEIQKYYWMSYTELIEDRVVTKNMCVDIHPLSTVWSQRLVSWNEINKIEYDEFNIVT